MARAFPMLRFSIVPQTTSHVRALGRKRSNHTAKHGSCLREAALQHGAPFAGKGSAWQKQAALCGFFSQNVIAQQLCCYIASN